MESRPAALDIDNCDSHTYNTYKASHATSTHQPPAFSAATEIAKGKSDGTDAFIRVWHPSEEHAKVEATEKASLGNAQYGSQPKPKYLVGRAEQECAVAERSEAIDVVGSLPCANSSRFASKEMHLSHQHVHQHHSGSFSDRIRSALASQDGDKDIAANIMFFPRGVKVKVAHWYHICAWAVAIILSAVYFSWNAGLEAGFASFALASVLTGVAFLVLSVSAAEMCSALPTAKSSIGFAYKTMGRYPSGFVGLCEALEYVLATSVNVLLLSELCTQLFSTDPSYEPLWIVLTYAVCLGFQLCGGSVVWNLTLGLTLLQLGILIFYAVGCFTLKDAQGLSFATNTFSSGHTEHHDSGYIVGGFEKFMFVLPLAVWWYVGIEAIPLACDDTHEAKKNVPKGLMAGIYTVILFSALVFLIGSSVPAHDQDGNAGVTAFLSTTYPLVFGLNYILGEPGLYSSKVLLFFVPGIFAACFGFVYAYGQHCYAMSRAGFLPRTLSRVWGPNAAPYLAIISASMVGLGICVFARCYNVKDSKIIIYNVMLLAALTNYVILLITFAFLRVGWPDLHRPFRSTVGIPGAVVGIVLFLLCLVAVLGWSPLILESVYIFVAYLVLGFGFLFFMSKRFQR